MVRTALCLGGGDTLHRDIELVKSIGLKYDCVVACNDAGSAWKGDLEAWVTFHPEKWPGWIKSRSEAGGSPSKLFYTHRKCGAHGVPEDNIVTGYYLPGQVGSGSSGLFMAKVALVDMGLDRVVFAGVPLTKTPHFFDTKAWRACNGFRKAWHTLDEEIKAKMKSCSGWTRVLLGGPDPWALQQ